MLKYTITLIALLISPAVYANNAEEIMAVDRSFGKLAGEQGRAAAYTRYMSKNPVSLEHDALPRIGHEAILRGFVMEGDGKMEGGKPAFSVSWAPEAGAIAKAGDMAYTWGIYTAYFTTSGETEHSTGKYMSVWIKEEGEWKLSVDIGNENPAE